MKHIITVQHTQSVHHNNGMVGSWTDWDLTELGRTQADRIGRKLKEELAGKAVVLYSSDLKRARQTAEAIISGMLSKMQATASTPSATRRQVKSWTSQARRKSQERMSSSIHRTGLMPRSGAL